MERIYFDKQIFSHLFKGEKSAYQKFLQNLTANKDKFLFCYSHGHLLDLNNDKTDIKFKELDFMESLVKDNYLSYHALDKRTSCYLAKPREAFEEIQGDDDPISFSTLFDDIELNDLTPEQREQVNKAKVLFTNKKLDFDFSELDKIPKELFESLSKVLPTGVSSMTLMEWTEYFIGTVKSMEEDKTVYKGLRNVIDKHLNNGKFTVDFDSIDFNDDLKNSVLQKSFKEYVNGNLNPNGDKEVTDYDFFTNAYFTLDLLGISKEPSKNVKFNNVMNDAYHAYYGAFCDYVVSDDQGFLKKARAMYRLIGIETNVFHIDDFIKYFALLSKSHESDANSLFDLLVADLKNGLVIDSKPSSKSNRHTTVIKPHHTYFGYFNRINSIKQDNHDYVFLTRKTNNYSYFSFYREYEGIINKAVKVFGEDYEFRGEFDWNTEISEIKEGKWRGRFWDFGSMTILIEINVGLKEICCLVTPKK